MTLVAPSSVTPDDRPHAAPGPGDPTPAGSILDLAERWGAQGDISARSSLVTILGDTVAPLGGTVWLSDLIELAEPFGFNERLVRTSLFRLAEEGWVVSERVGRRSRYSLTEFGRDETAAAENRIYRPPHRAWDGSWTLVFTAGMAPSTQLDELVRLLRWRGFASIADGVHGRPNDIVAEIGALVDRLGLAVPPPVAAARFDDRMPVGASPFRSDSGLAAAEDGYRRFVERYRWTAAAELGRVDQVEAFALRTMIVHDLRRVLLNDPELPPAVLPGDWIGRQAKALAADAYRAVTNSAWRWVETVTEQTVDAGTTSTALRFAEPEPPDPGPTREPASTGDPESTRGPEPALDSEPGTARADDQTTEETHR